VQDATVEPLGCVVQCQPLVLAPLKALSSTVWASPQLAGLPSFADEVTA
jgi:hypothetical protein